MSWPERRLALPLAAVLVMAGCGFHPLYADNPDHPGLRQALASVKVHQMANREGQELTNWLRDAFDPTGIGAAGTYELDAVPNIGTFNQLAQADSTSARSISIIKVRWSLKRLSDGKVVTQGLSLVRVGNDVIVTNDYANVVATQTEIDRGLREVSLDIQNRVADWLQTAS